jgi:hypothetical protein
MLASRTTFFALSRPPEQKAEIDFLVASADLKTLGRARPRRGREPAGSHQGGKHAMEAYLQRQQGNVGEAAG